MAIRLALLEVSLLVFGISGTVLLWNRPMILDWIDVIACLGQAMALALSCVTAFYYNDLFDIRKVRGLGEFGARLIQALGVSFILLALCYALFPDLQLANGPFFSSLLILGGLVVPVRAGFYALMRSHAISERVLILGTGSLAWKIAAEMTASPHLGYTVIGIVDDGGPIPLWTSAATRPSILGSLEQLSALVEEHHPDRIVVTLAERRGRLPVNDLLEIRMHGTAVEDGIAIYERLTGKLAIESLMPSYLIFSQDFSKPRWQTALRRAVSLIVAAAGLIIAWPFMLVIACVIWIDSGGPILFIQERVGFKERIFPLLKFRSMHPSAGTTSEGSQDNAHRLTRVGKWLRKFRLDELPQFVNILRGDMDIVGPRPHRVPRARYFIEAIPYYSTRLTVRPGITGWAQVQHGYGNSLEQEAEKVRYDLYFIKHMSIRFDLRILIDTVKIVLFSRGSGSAASNVYHTESMVEARDR